MCVYNQYIIIFSIILSMYIYLKKKCVRINDSNQKIPTIQTNGTDDIHHRASGDKL